MIGNRELFFVLTIDAGIKKQLAELQERLKVYWKNEQQKYQGLFEK